MFSLPKGKITEKNAELLTIDFIKFLKENQKRAFTGYIALCIQGANGIEEGTILFDEGKIVGCFYEYYSFDKSFQGNEAFQRILNASAAKQGVFDVISLKPEQVRLVLAVNEGIVFVPAPGQLESVSVKEFSPLFEQEVVQSQSEQTRTEFLKKFKLQDLGKT